MAPAASILAAPTAASSKRPPASDTEQQQLLVDSSAHPQQGDGEAARKSQQPKQQQLECPRCRSTNTKFCYYNNYSTAQPRHFCRACRRYWTHGGTLRDVPVGGATRRCKRRRVSSEPPPSPQQQQKTAALVEDVALCPPVPSTAAFPFLSDGSYLPQLDLGCLFAPPAFSGAPDFYDGLAPWDVGTVGSGAAGVTGAWGDIAGMELTWPPPGN